MTRQERLDQLILRMQLPENEARRNPATRSEADKNIKSNMSDMRNYLIVLNDKTGADLVFTEKQFDRKYDQVVKLLDEQGWK